METIETLQKDKIRLEQAVSQMINQFADKYPTIAFDFDIVNTYQEIGDRKALVATSVRVNCKL